MTLDERLFFGDPAAATRKKRVPESAAAHAARMHGARPFPIAAAKILTLTARDDFDVGAVVRTLESDAPMAARVLRVVNSAVFGLRKKVTSIKHAVTLLGAKGVRDATIAGSVLNLFPGDGTKTWKHLHKHATLAGALARHLAPEWRLPVDEMFAAAFLHDIGKWILLEEERDYAKVLDACGAKFEGTLDEEHGIFGFDHAELAEHMLTAWAIPQPIPRVVGLHHDPVAAFEDSPGMATRVALLRLVDRLAHAYANDEEVDFAELAASDYCTYLAMDAGTLRDRFEALRMVDDSDDDNQSQQIRIASVPKMRAVRANRLVDGTPASDAAQGTSEPPLVAEQRCFDCESTAVARHCKRCDRAYCKPHAPERELLCHHCEDLFEELAVAQHVPSLFAGVSLLFFGLAAFAGAAFYRGARMALLSVAFGLIFAASIVALRRLGFRQRFMKPAS